MPVNRVTAFSRYYRVACPACGRPAGSHCVRSSGTWVEPHAERRSLANSVTGDLTSARPEPKPALPPVDRTIKTVGEPIGPFIPLHWDDEKSGQVVLIWVRASLVRTVRLRKVSGRRADRGAKRPGCLVIMANGTTYPVLEEIGAVLQALAEVE